MKIGALLLNLLVFSVMAEQQELAGVKVLVNSVAQAFGLMLQGRVDIVL
uniref:ABC transporter substrate-binding protein n=1 Tax=Rheinheimera sp. BAL341 TaxID=1708203 RepID=A0A486XUE8_9GAMM